MEAGWRQGVSALCLFIFSSFFFLSPLYHRHWRQPTWRHGASALCLFIFSFLFFPPLPQALEAVIVFRTLSIFVTAYGDFALLQVFFFCSFFIYFFPWSFAGPVRATCSIKSNTGMAANKISQPRNKRVFLFFS